MRPLLAAALALALCAQPSAQQTLTTAASPTASGRLPTRSPSASPSLSASRTFWSPLPSLSPSGTLSRSLSTTQSASGSPSRLPSATRLPSASAAGSASASSTRTSTGTTTGSALPPLAGAGSSSSSSPDLASSPTFIGVTAGLALGLLLALGAGVACHVLARSRGAKSAGTIDRLRQGLARAKAEERRRRGSAGLNPLSKEAQAEVKALQQRMAAAVAAAAASEAKAEVHAEAHAEAAAAAAEAAAAAAAAVAAAAAAAQEAPPLPPGWRVVQSRSKGRPFYVNAELQLKLWKPPCAGALTRKLAEHRAAVPAEMVAGSGWERIFNASKGAHFFFNLRTREKVWAAEGAAVHVPPPPQAAPAWLGPDLPGAWRAVWSKTKGKFFFVDTATHAKRWAWPAVAPAGALAAAHATPGAGTPGGPGGGHSVAGTPVPGGVDHVSVQLTPEADGAGAAAGTAGAAESVASPPPASLPPPASPAPEEEHSGMLAQGGEDSVTPPLSDEE